MLFKYRKNKTLHGNVKTIHGTGTSAVGTGTSAVGAVGAVGTGTSAVGAVGAVGTGTSAVGAVGAVGPTTMNIMTLKNSNRCYGYSMRDAMNSTSTNIRKKCTACSRSN